MQIVPLRFLSYRYKNDRSVAFKIRQNTPKSVFGRGSAPDPAGGAHDAPPAPLSAGEGTPLTIPHPHSALTHLRLSPCVPLRIPAYAYGCNAVFEARCLDNRVCPAHARHLGFFSDPTFNHSLYLDETFEYGKSG